MSIDPRLAAFCDLGSVTSYGPPSEVFSAVVHGNQVFGDDPFDVETLHAEARAVFRRLLDRASAPELPPAGKTLLLLGEAGSGKTHLMRAFRAHAHAHGHGYCGYLQMTSRAENYARYILANLIDSLEQPYRTGATGLSRLARGVLDAASTITQAEREDLVDGGLEPEALARLVHRMSSVVAQQPRFGDIDLDLVRALLYVLVDDGLVHALAIKWLRCEPLSRLDRELLGDLAPRTAPEMPLRTIVALGRLMGAVHSAALVLLVDQIEEVVELSDDGVGGTVLRGAVNTLVDVADALPNAVVVVACLEDLFVAARRALPGPKLDRLERDPEPVSLVANRSAVEVEGLVARRLQVLYDEHGIDTDRADPTFPFSVGDLAPLAGQRTRDVLDWCRRHRERCVGAGQWVDPDHGVVPLPVHAHTPPPAPAAEPEAGSPPGNPAVTAMARRWNDFLAEWAPQSTLAEATMAELVGWVAGAVSSELREIAVYASVDGPNVAVAAVRGEVRDEWLVAVCEASSRGGALSRRIEEVALRARGRPVAFVRSTPFPRDAKTRVAAQLTALCRPVGPGRRVIVENADWRAMEAFRAFHDLYHDEAGFGGWARGDRPLTRLRAVRAMFDLDRFDVLREGGGTAPAGSAPASRLDAGETLAPPPPGAASGPIPLGARRGGVPGAVTVDPDALVRHAAIVGSPGCGTTTGALSVIEGLLERGVPVLVVDRQGDLCRHADPDAWAEPEPDPARAARRDQLRARVAVEFVAPGVPARPSPGGPRPWALPLVPRGFAEAPEAERERIAGEAASALGGLMGYRTRSHEPRRAVLERAIAALGDAASVPQIEAAVRDRDPRLLAEAAGIDARHFDALADDLRTVWLRHRRLLDAPAGDDGLDARLAAHPERPTPLTLVTTRFLGEEAAVDFWVSQLLLALDHWRVRQPPGGEGLRAALVLEDADRLIPAGGRLPTTRAALVGLLGRARSAGLGVVLVSRSPGDLDDRARELVETWLVGQLKERSAAARLRPMLEAAHADLDELPTLAPGQFHLVGDGGGERVDLEPSLIPPRRIAEERLLRLG